MLTLYGIAFCLLLSGNVDAAQTCEGYLASARFMAGAYMPQCAEDGNYRAVQCHASTGYCWCVETREGTEINGTRIRFMQPTCETVSPKGPCQTQLDNSATPPLLGSYLPQCDANGTYNAMQCHGSTGHCWCVDPQTNQEIDGSRVIAKYPDCSGKPDGGPASEPVGGDDDDDYAMYTGNARAISLSAFLIMFLSTLCLLHLE